MRHLFILITALSLSLPPATTAPVYALDAPIPLAPADGAVTTAADTPPLGLPDFAWTAVRGATSYRIQFSQDIGFAIKVEATTPYPRYTPTDVAKFGDGAWYWRVRVDTPAPASDYSATQFFTKQWASPDAAPTLAAPDDGIVLDFYDRPAFAWTAVTGAASYRMQIAASPDGFGSAVYNGTTLATAHQPAAKLPNGSYYWRVTPLDPAGREGTPSDVRGFTASYSPIPTLLEPADGATPTFTPTFRWTAARGAQFYRLQYATDPTFNAGITTIDTRNTTYTPTDDLPNDVNYYWRVRVHSGVSVGDWSAVRRFRKQWYIQPQLLTPTNNYQYLLEPLFSWTPAPGAAYYKFEINCANSFPPAIYCGWSDTVANPFYSLRPVTRRWMAHGSWYWWRVTPINSEGDQGQPSQSFSFVYRQDGLAPQLAYPMFHYPPSDLHAPREDRTVALPAFIWHRVPYSNTQPGAYRIQVDDDPLFGSIEWSVETQNLNATPTASNAFIPRPGVDYYWRVRSLYRFGDDMSDWSQRWKTRIDTRLGLTPTAGAAPTLLRPTVGSEWVETMPLLEWWPLTGADSYEVQISPDPTFAAELFDATVVNYPIYAPALRPAYGTYYWRVRGRAAGVPVGEWSAVWRFEQAASSHWAYQRARGEPENRWRIATDPVGDMIDPPYDLADLFAAQSKDYWYFSFHAYPNNQRTTYALYLDLDRAEPVAGGAAASVRPAADPAGLPAACATPGAEDPRGYCVSTIPAHQPEYAVYVTQNNFTFSREQTFIYHRVGDQWIAPQTLAEVGGSLVYSPTGFFVELEIPATAIGMEETTGGASVALFSAMPDGGHAQDTVPADPAVAFANADAGQQITRLSRFTAVSERLTPIAPPSNSTGDPALWPSLIPFSWHWPVEVFWYSWHGYDFQAAVDPNFTSVVESYTVWFSPAAMAPSSYTAADDLQGDNSYYWRVRPVYDYFKDYRGAWSQPWRLERAGLVPANPRTSVTFATPTFSWDRVEGAEEYELQVDNDPGFGSPAVSVRTAAISYTPPAALPKGVYSWRVRVRRYGNVINDWTPAQTFTLDTPDPTDLRTWPPGTTATAPTFCWTHTLASDGSVPVLAAWKYRVQVSRDPTFSSLYDSTDTEQACWTPTKGYEDGTFYWRVAMLDGSLQLGDYSPAATVVKQYPLTDLVSPARGELVRRTITFAWTPVPGAASYKLEVSNTASFALLVESVTTNNTRYTPTRLYTGGRTYYWRVAMADRDKRQGPFTGSEVILALYPYSSYLPLAMRR